MKQSWIRSAKFDLSFILSPAIIISILVLFFRNDFIGQDFSPIYWLVLVLFIDVSHVYSSLFRTYLDSYQFKKNRFIFTIVPILSWVILCILYSIQAIYFWRVLAYLAVFHFIRQQYGFMMLYSRFEKDRDKLINKLVIYAATLFPLIYWHCSGDRKFNWFIKGDFIIFNSSLLKSVSIILYLLILIVYLVSEIRYSLKVKQLNIPKNALLLGTVLSWFLGIVYFNNDLIFTATNVIAHGIPYMALIWVYKLNEQNFRIDRFSWLFSIKKVPIYLGILFLLAYLEEAIWDTLIWSEHKSIFFTIKLGAAISDYETLSWMIPLLALPQVTHYILDAYIWRFKEDPELKQILFYGKND